MISVVIPVYNAVRYLPKAVESAVKQNTETELILVDDCSADNSYQVIEELRKKDKRVNGIQLAVNHGQPKAILCGFSYVHGDYVITMDDDLQHPPEEIPKLIEKMNSADDIDVVIGEYDSKKHNAVKRMGTKLMNMMSNTVYHKSNNLKITSFRLMKRYVVDNLNKIAVSRPMIGPLLLQTNKRMVNVTVKHAPRVYGKSGYSFKKLVREFRNNLITNSDLPLKLIGYMGLFSAFLSIAFIIFFIIRYFVNGSGVSGWTSIIVLLLFFGGMTLFSVGILGRYLISIMVETKKFPKFLVRKVDMTEDPEKDD